MDAAHEAAALAVEIRVDFLLEGRFVEIPRSNGHAEGDGFLLCFACHVLVHGDGGVDAPALAEEGAHRSPGAFGGDEDHVDVGGDVDFGEVLEDGGEAVGEIKGLWRGELGSREETMGCIPFPW